jgi:type II secretory ATPase GspE/PulE/Tfp pilus assembly ATPase PilB-like protein
MGLKSYLISSSVICILAQRLVKILCPHCKEKMLLNDEYKIKFGLELNQSFEVYKEKGCEECNFTGFISRKGIFELLNIDEKIREMIMLKKHIDEIKTYCVYKKMYFLSDSVLDLFLKGETSVTEVLGIIYK